MKRRNALSLLLSLTLLLSLALPATTAYADDGSSGSGMEISKTAVANADGSYTITLESYATGSKVITEIKNDVPTDIILVLDQSGSMAHCITCGKEIDYYNNQTHKTYAAVDTVSENGTYYIKNGSSYTQVSYCNGEHRFFSFSYSCDGGAGWYTSTRRSDHTQGNKISPETTQFYGVSGTEACTSRLSALKTAVTSFAGAVATKAAGADGILSTKDDINHRIAVVGYADTDWDYGYNTGVFIGSTLHRYSSAAAGVYGKALQDMSTDAGKANVTASIDALQASGATRTDYGLTMANGILNANPVPQGEKRNRVVIVFTDGSPTSSSGFENSVANSAISTANTIKNGGTTVYSIGIFSGADATSAGNQNGSETQKANWFMQQMSSNNGTPQSPSYYLSAGDAASLNNIFQQISSQIEEGGSSTTLNESTVIKDIIAPQFTLPEDVTVGDITLETWKCTGKNGDAYTWSKNPDAMGAQATISSTDDSNATTTSNQVSVTGFDFAKNYVGTVTENGSTTYRGNKLVISFKVQPKAGFLGGNNVPTNSSAGIYENASAENPLLTFERPTVNVPIKDVTVTAKDKNVYLKGEVTADQLKDGATVKVGDVELDLSKAADTDKPYGLDSWQTEYVDITVTVKDKDGNVISDKLEDLKEDTTYTVEVTVAPKPGSTPSSEGTPATAKTGTSEKKIKVFKPVLTFKDSTAYYGETVPADYSANKTAEAWKHGTTDSTAVTMLGTNPPELKITYTPDASKLAGGKINTKQDVPVAVTVKIGAENVNEHTTFVHDDNCTVENCGWETPKTLGDPAFLIHIKTCTLSITKQGGAGDESYVFDVCKDGEKYSEVTVWGNGTETLVELPIGTYTISENQGWSWRYSADNGGSAELTAKNPTGSITCINTKNNDQWLNGFSTVVQNIFGMKH